MCKEKIMFLKNFWKGITVMVLVFGFAVMGCNDGTTDSENNGGILTITDIPSIYNGKYTFFSYYASENSNIVGCKNINVSTNTFELVPITNGITNIPLWIPNSNGTLSKYFGNDGMTIFVPSANSYIRVDIYDTATFSKGNGQSPIAKIDFLEVYFKNGNATISANKGTITP